MPEWINIAVAITAILSGLLDVKNAIKEFKAKPNPKTDNSRVKTVLLLSVLLITIISVLEIMKFVENPVLENVFSLCFNTSLLFFAWLYLFMILLFGRLIDSLKNHLELTKAIVEETRGREVVSEKILSIVEKLTVSDEEVDKRLFDLEYKLGKLKNKFKK